MNLLLYLLLISILFIIYTEINLKHILIRPNSENKLTINLNSLLSFLIHPFHNLTLWNRSILDLNYCFILSISIIIYFAFYIFKNIYILQL